MNYLMLYCVLMMFWLAQYSFFVFCFVECTQYIHVYAIKMIKFFFLSFPLLFFSTHSIHCIHIFSSSRHQAESRKKKFFFVILKAIEIDRGAPISKTYSKRDVNHSKLFPKIQININVCIMLANIWMWVKWIRGKIYFSICLVFHFK